MTDKLIESVARAIAGYGNCSITSADMSTEDRWTVMGSYGQPLFTGTNRECWDWVRTAPARAATLAVLRGIREPTDAMVGAQVSPANPPKGYKRGTWQAMIDTILAEIENG